MSGPPYSRKKQISAAGSGHRNENVKKFCCTSENWDDSFQQKSPLVAGDWLSGPGCHERGGETFSSFKRFAKKQKRPSQQLKIYLVPIGRLNSEDGKTSIDIDAIVEFTKAYLMAPVEVIDGIDDDAVQEFRGSRKYKDGGIFQLRTDACHKAIWNAKPVDAFCAVGVTMYDIFPGEEWNFVFGEASPRTMTGIFSFARYRENLTGPEPFVNEQLFLKRCAHVVVHEIGHLYGIQHCVWFQCCMNGANHLEENDSQPIHLCPVDLRKLHYRSLSPRGKQFSIVDRYNNLKSWYTQHGFKEDADWVQKRLSTVLGDKLPENDEIEMKIPAQRDDETLNQNPKTESESKGKTKDFEIFVYLLENYLSGIELNAQDLKSKFGMNIGRAKRAMRSFISCTPHVADILESLKDSRDDEETKMQKVFDSVWSKKRRKFD